MFESRRPSRSKKTVNYSIYSAFGNDGDSDGDFADPTPPTKRVKKEKRKTDKKPDKKQKEKSTKDPTSRNKPSQRKERQPLDQKIFDRDLELALELSKQDSQTSSQSDSDGVQYMGNKQREIAVVVHTPGAKPEGIVPEETQNHPLPVDPLRTPETDKSDNKENVEDKDVHIPIKTKTSPNIVNIDEEPLTLIETLEGSEAERGGRRTRKAASAAVAKQREMMSDEDDGGDDGDDEFKADDPKNNFASDSDDDDDFDAGDADSDFEGSSSKNKKKGNTSKARGGEKKTPKAKPVKKERSTKAKSKGKTNSAVSSHPKASVTSPITPIARRPQSKGPGRGFTPPSISSKVSSGDKNSQQTFSSSSQSVVRKPWCSPSSSNANNPLGGVKLVSPSQPLRLGLSRHARIKPLHSNVKVP